MSPYPLVFWYVLVAGLLASTYLYKEKFKPSAAWLGATSVVFGLAGILASYVWVTTSAYSILSILFLLSQAVTLYFGLKDSRKRNQR